MNNVITNGFCELNENEMVTIDGGTDMNESVHDLFAVIGAGAGYVVKGVKGYWNAMQNLAVKFTTLHTNKGGKYNEYNCFL